MPSGYPTTPPSGWSGPRKAGITGHPQPPGCRLRRRCWRKEENFVGLIDKVEATPDTVGQYLTWTHPTLGYMGSRNRAPITATLNPPATIPCCSSTATVIVGRRSSVPPTLTVPRAARNSRYLRSTANRGWGNRSPFERQQPWPSQWCTKHWKSGARSTRFAFRPTTICSGTSASYGKAPWEGPPRHHWSSTGVFRTRPKSWKTACRVVAKV